MSTNPIQKSKLSAIIKAVAQELGFSACGIAKAEPVDPAEQQKFAQWLKSGFQGNMTYMESYSDKRMNPLLLVPGAKSIISLAINYHQTDHQSTDSHYRISQYAAGCDYHYVIKEKLNQMMESLSKHNNIENYRIFVDSAPVAERYWAQKAGLGWIGKNSCLIIPKRGSFFFLSEIILDTELEYDKPLSKNLCGNCTKCADACPTGAITKSGHVDAQRCISYLTIESKEDIPEELGKKMTRFIFGCDICQEVCPHNVQFAKPCSEPLLAPLAAVKNWSRSEWEALTSPLFRKNFVKTHSPIARAGFNKLQRSISLVNKSNLAHN